MKDAPQATSSTGSPETPTAVRRRRIIQTNWSLLATGEPLIFITGGALVVCLVAITGLLGLVFYEGARTFWPGPVIQVGLVDGTTRVGEVVRSEEYLLMKDRIPSESGPLTEAAVRTLADADRRSVRRRLFRTGNYEVTQTHFRWISDFEIATGTELAPDDMLVLERIEWGRFYGTPSSFVIREVRIPSPDERELSQLLEFFQQWQSLLDPQLVESLNQELGSIEKQRDAIRARNIQTFIKEATATTDGLPGAEESDSAGATRSELELADGSVVPWNRASIAANDAKSGTDELPLTVTAMRHLTEGSSAAWQQLQKHHASVLRLREKQHEYEKGDLETLNRELEQRRLGVRLVELETRAAILDRAAEWMTLSDQLRALEKESRDTLQLVGQVEERFPQSTVLRDAASQILRQRQKEFDDLQQPLRMQQAELQKTVDESPASVKTAVERYWQTYADAATRREEIQRLLQKLNDNLTRFTIHMTTAETPDVELRVADIVRAYPANGLTWPQRCQVYVSRWWEFLSDEPREANSEGGVFPAIWGTVVMTLVMSMAVVPFGVLAALYLREYAGGGLIVSLIRIALNNLAGVPSIVFGVFGLGFFCYLLGAYVDGGAANIGVSAWPPRLWWMGIGGLAIVGTGAFVTGLLSLSTPRASASGTKRAWQVTAGVLWVAATGLLFLLIFFNPYFSGLFRAELPNPTYGKGGLLWSALTLAMMTLPVVIVATEESLSAVPNSMREGSYACGAGKWQTIRRIVLPQALPGIMTGMILAMARGAGEVAPLMLVGAVKLVPELPVDGHFPFVHPERSFMHLGFHIYDLGFQSPNSEAAKPMVFTTTLLLIVLIATLNISAGWLRAKLKRRIRTGQF
ncbi:MAG: Phosphate transport system permease protein PstA [Planctomycetota bacterium]